MRDDDSPSNAEIASLPKGPLRRKNFGKFRRMVEPARIVVALAYPSGLLAPLYGTAAYLLAGGPDTVPSGERADEGFDRNAWLPPGTTLIGVKDETDDIRVMIQLLSAMGRLDKHDPESN